MSVSECLLKVDIIRGSLQLKYRTAPFGIMSSIKSYLSKPGYVTYWCLSVGAKK